MLMFPSFSWAVEVFSLENSIEYGLTHSPALEGGKIKINQAGMDIKAERGRFLPSVTTNYSYNQLFSEYASGLADRDYLDQKNNTASIKISQALFAGFENKNRFDRAKLSKEYQKAQLAIQKLDLAYQIKVVFFELLKTRYDLSSIDQRIKRLESDLQGARAFSNNRIAPYVYVLQAEADLEGAKQELWQTQTAVYKHSARLKSLLGITRSRDLVEFNDDFEVPVEGLGKDLDYCLDKALLTRPEIRLLNLQSGMAKKDANIAKSRYYPRVNLDLGLSDVDKKYDYTATTTVDNESHYTYWNAGVTVQINLFDGGTAHYNKRRYLLEINRLKTERNQLKMEIEEEVAVALHSFQEAQKRLVSVEKALIASQESYDRQKKRFHASIGTISEVLDAQAMLVRSESTKSQTMLDCQIFMAQLFHAMGMEQISFEPETPPGQIKPKLNE